MTINDYTGYMADDLLKDDFFIHSVLHPTPESELLWENQNRVTKEMAFAKFFIESVQVKTEDFSGEEIDAMWNNIQTKNEKSRLAKSRKIKQITILLSIAAGFLLIVSIGYFWFFKETGSPVEKRIDMASLTVPQTNTQDIQLILSNGTEQMSIKEKSAEINYDAQGNVTVTTGKARLSGINEPERNDLQAFNQLIVPPGKRSKLILSDGSEIWVNAGTRVVYPAVFEEKERAVFVEGEVFLNVIPDKKHPFIVRTNYMDVNVLGTSFNLSAYKEDNCFAVVLVDGSVSATKTGEKEEFRISPGERLTCSEQSVLITEVNTYNYTSWKDGLFYFQSENMGAILKRLSRYYGKEIACDEKTAGQKCSGKLDLIDELQDILNGFTHALPIKIEERNNAFNIRWNE